MGKRSDFQRVAKDYYRTFDPKAGNAILPHIGENYTYAEPFCGRGDLIKQLKGKCEYASDIQPEHEFNETGLTFHEKSYNMVTDADLQGCDLVISNPPWSRPILHDSIEFFASKKPTWFLFDANWMFTKQSGYYLNKYCVKIVRIGRMQWIEDTSGKPKMQAKDDACWYFFIPSKKEDDVIEYCW